MNAHAQVNDDKKRILVVEDDAEIIKLHVNFLSDNFTVIIASSGLHAIRYLKGNHDIHLVLVDVKLPDISGIEVLKEIKKTKPFVPTIIITAFGNEDVAVKAFRCGARDYIKKPFSYEELINRMNCCLSMNDLGQAEHRRALTDESEEFANNIIQGMKATGKNYRMEQALKYIHANYLADICLDHVADTASISKYHFSRKFKEITGLTFRSYVNRIRIEHAKKLLDADVLSITDVGYSVGYSDLTHFERIFKKIVGSTPTQYKRVTPNPCSL